MFEASIVVIKSLLVNLTTGSKSVSSFGRVALTRLTLSPTGGKSGDV